MAGDTRNLNDDSGERPAIGLATIKAKDVAGLFRQKLGEAPEVTAVNGGFAIVVAVDDVAKPDPATGKLKTDSAAIRAALAGKFRTVGLEAAAAVLAQKPVPVDSVRWKVTPEQLRAIEGVDANTVTVEQLTDIVREKDPAVALAEVSHLKNGEMVKVDGATKLSDLAGDYFITNLGDPSLSRSAVFGAQGNHVARQYLFRVGIGANQLQPLIEASAATGTSPDAPAATNPATVLSTDGGARGTDNGESIPLTEPPSGERRQIIHGVSGIRPLAAGTAKAAAVPRATVPKDAVIQKLRMIQNGTPRYTGSIGGEGNFTVVIPETQEAQAKALLEQAGFKGDMDKAKVEPHDKTQWSVPVAIMEKLMPPNKIQDAIPAVSTWLERVPAAKQTIRQRLASPDAEPTYAKDAVNGDYVRIDNVNANITPTLFIDAVNASLPEGKPKLAKDEAEKIKVTGKTRITIPEKTAYAGFGIETGSPAVSH